MYYNICDRCGAHLDPNEKCTCRRELENQIAQISAMLKMSKSGQMEIAI